MGHSSSKQSPGSIPQQRRVKEVESKSISRGEFILVNSKALQQLEERDRRALPNRSAFSYAHRNIPSAISVPVPHIRGAPYNVRTNRYGEFDGYERHNRQAAFNELVGVKHGLSLGNGLNEIKEEDEEPCVRLPHDTRRHSMYELLDDYHGTYDAENAPYYRLVDIAGFMASRGNNRNNSVTARDNACCKSSAPTYVSEDSAISLRHDARDHSSASEPSSSVTSENDDQGLRHTDSDTSRFSAFLPESTSSSIKGAHVNSNVTNLNISNNENSGREYSDPTATVYLPNDTESSICSVTSLEESTDAEENSRSSTLRNRTSQREEKTEQTQPRANIAEGTPKCKERHNSCGSSSSATLANASPHAQNQDNSFDTDGSDISSISCSKRAMRRQNCPRKVELKVGDALSNFTTVLTFGSFEDSDNKTQNTPSICQEREATRRTECGAKNGALVKTANNAAVSHPKVDSYNTCMKTVDSELQIRRYLDEQDALKLWSDMPAPPIESFESIKGRVPLGTDVPVSPSTAPVRNTNIAIESAAENSRCNNTAIINGRAPPPTGGTQTTDKTTCAASVNGHCQQNDDGTSHQIDIIRISNKATDEITACTTHPKYTNEKTTDHAPILSVPKVVEAKNHVPISDRSDLIPAYGYHLDYAAYDKAMRQHKTKFGDVLRQVKGESSNAAVVEKTAVCTVAKSNECTSAHRDNSQNNGERTSKTIRELQDILMQQANPFSSVCPTRMPPDGHRRFSQSPEETTMNRSNIAGMTETVSDTTHIARKTSANSRPASLEKPANIAPPSIILQKNNICHSYRDTGKMVFNEIAPPQTSIIERTPSVIHYTKTKTAPVDGNATKFTTNGMSPASDDVPVRMKVSDIKSMLEKSASQKGGNTYRRESGLRASNVSRPVNDVAKYRRQLSTDDIVLIEGNAAW